jgi:hypothetical protein
MNNNGSWPGSSFLDAGKKEKSVEVNPDHANIIKLIKAFPIVRYFNTGKVETVTHLICFVVDHVQYVLCVIDEPKKIYRNVLCLHQGWVYFSETAIPIHEWEIDPTNDVTLVKSIEKFNAASGPKQGAKITELITLQNLRSHSCQVF